MKPYFSTLMPARLTKTLLFESLIENGSSHTNGGYLIFQQSYHTQPRHSGFQSSFDRGCLSLWFTFRRNVNKLLPLLNTSIDSLTVLPQIIYLSCFTHCRR